MLLILSIFLFVLPVALSQMFWLVAWWYSHSFQSCSQLFILNSKFFFSFLGLRIDHRAWHPLSWGYPTELYFQTRHFFYLPPPTMHAVLVDFSLICSFLLHLRGKTLTRHTVEPPVYKLCLLFTALSVLLRGDSQLRTDRKENVYSQL